MRINLATAIAAAVILIGAGPAAAANHEVQMLNKGEAGTMVFEPAFLQIEVGDTVTFVPTDKTHNAETMKEILPEGGETFKGGISKEVSVTFTVPGAYGIKCLPHVAMGMVGLVVVGDAPENIDQAREVKLPKKAKERMDAALAEFEAQ